MRHCEVQLPGLGCTKRKSKKEKLEEGSTGDSPVGWWVVADYWHGEAYVAFCFVTWWWCYVRGGLKFVQGGSITNLNLKGVGVGWVTKHVSVQLFILLFKPPNLIATCGAPLSIGC